MSKEKKLIIALTGGIGSGKTTVTKLFSELGIPIIDTDQIAREIVEPPSLLLIEIKKHFGSAILNIDGSLNRSLLRARIFQDQHEKKWLEALLHPAIIEIALARANDSDAPYCIVVIPLLIESFYKSDNPWAKRYLKLIDKILVVDSSEDLQRQRAAQRDQLSEAAIQAIMDTQVSRSERLAYADNIIRNFSDEESLKEQVLKLHREYLTL